MRVLWIDHPLKCKSQDFIIQIVSGQILLSSSYHELVLLTCFFDVELDKLSVSTLNIV